MDNLPQAAGREVLLHNFTQSFNPLSNLKQQKDHRCSPKKAPEPGGLRCFLKKLSSQPIIS